MTKKKKLKHVLFSLVIFVTASFAFSYVYAQNNAADGAGMIGVWEDGETHDLITIKKVNGVPTVVSIIDQDDSSKKKVVSTSFKNGILEFKYYVPSTGYNVTMRTISLSEKGLYYHWDNTYSKGDDTLKRMMDIVADDKNAKSIENPASKVKKGKLIGKIYKINKDEIIVAVADTSSSLKMGDKLFIIVDDEKINLNVSFPMMTISRCKISGADKKNMDKIKLNAQVYK